MKLDLVNVTWPASCLLIGFALDIDAFAYIGMWCSEVFCQQTMLWKRLSVGFSWVWGESIWLPRTTHWELSLDIILSYFTEPFASEVFSCSVMKHFYPDEGGLLQNDHPSHPYGLMSLKMMKKHMQWSSQSTYHFPLTGLFSPPFNLPLVYMFKIAVCTYYF